MGQRVTLTGRVVVAGSARGSVLASHEPLSFWGGYDPKTGEIIDRRHPLTGLQAAGTVLAVPFTRGSSTTTAILLESVRAGTAPCALLCTATDTFLALAAVVADELYGKKLAVIALSQADFDQLFDAEEAIVSEDGTVVLTMRDA